MQLYTKNRATLNRLPFSVELVHEDCPLAPSNI